MRKRIKGRKFSRNRSQKKALLKGLVQSLFINEKIITTKARAKEVSGMAEKMITRAKKGDLASIRLLRRSLTAEVVKKLQENIAPRYKQRKGGFTRVIKLVPRKSDAAEIAIIELVE